MRRRCQNCCVLVDDPVLTPRRADPFQPGYTLRGFRRGHATDAWCETCAVARVGQIEWHLAVVGDPSGETTEHVDHLRAALVGRAVA